MADLIASSNGNWSGALSWNACDQVTIKKSGNVTLAVTTSAQYSAATIPGAITVDGVAIQLAKLGSSSPTGTITVSLRNTTLGADVDSVTINTADLPTFETAANFFPYTVNSVVSGSWHFFKFSSSHLLLAATNYAIGVSASNASQVYLLGSGTSDWNRLVSTTTTANPAAADLTYIGQEYTGVGAHTIRTITMNNNDATSFGAIQVSNGGFVNYDYSNNTQLRLVGDLKVFTGGEFNIGTSTNRIASGKKAKLEVVGIAVGSRGISSVGGTFRAYGQVPSFQRCLLDANALVGATSLTVNSSTGWTSGSTIVIAGTDGSATHYENLILTGNASGTTLPIPALAYSHNKFITAADTKQCDIVLLDRNCLIQGITFSTFITQVTGNVYMDGAELNFFGGPTGLKQGVVTGDKTGAGVFSITNSSTHDSGGTVPRMFAVATGSNSVGFVYQHNSICKAVSAVMSIVENPDNTWIIDDVVMIGLAAGASLTEMGGTISNITIANCGGASFTFGEGDITDSDGYGTISNLISYSSSGTSFNFTNAPDITQNRTILGLKSLCITGAGAAVNLPPLSNTTRGIIIKNATILGSPLAAMFIPGSAQLLAMQYVLDGCLIDGAPSYPTPIGLNIDPLSYANSLTDFTVNNSTIGGPIGLTTACVNIGDATVSGHAAVKFMQFNNCYFNGPIILTNLDKQGPTKKFFRVGMSRINGVANSWKSYVPGGTSESDYVLTYGMVYPSEKLTPNSVSTKLCSSSMFMNVPSGKLGSIVIAIQINGYGGNDPRLIVKYNPAMGINTDTVIHTFTGIPPGSWHSAIATSPYVTESGTLEFCIDCDGTSGTVNVAYWRGTATI